MAQQGGLPLTARDPACRVVERESLPTFDLPGVRLVVGVKPGARVERLKELDPGEDNMLLRVTPSLKGTTTTMGGHPDAKPK